MPTKQLLAFITVCLVLAGCKKETVTPLSVYQNYAGYFSGRELSCTVTTPGQYNVRISLLDSSKVSIYNIWNAGDTCIGDYRPDGNVYIPLQSFDRGDGSVSGKATIIGGKLRISYSVNHYDLAHQTDNCIWVQD